MLIGGDPARTPALYSLIVEFERRWGVHYCIGGTGALVVNALKSNKKQFPGAVLVADENGTGLRQWQLEKASSAIVITDPAGIVRYFKQGAMSDAQIESALQLVRQYNAADAPPMAAAGAATAP